MIEVYAVNINKNTSYLEDLIFLLSEEKQIRINKYLRVEDSLRALLGDLLLRSIICSKYSIKNDQIDIKYNDYGKPFINNLLDIEFNISHSGEWVVCAIDDISIGIDIEEIKHIDFSISECFFTKLENKCLFNKNKLEKPKFFYELWTGKESFVKAIGKGLSIPLNSFYIKPNETYSCVKTIDKQIFGHEKQYYIKKYNINNYPLAVCSTKKIFPKDIIFKDINEIVNDLSYKLE